MNWETDTDLPKNSMAGAEDTFADLRSRQSVRATFKLTHSCIEAISIVAAQLGIKQKALFDHLLQDTRNLNAIASRFSNARLQTSHRVQKTYVISRGALLSLEEAARNFNAPRDALVEFSVQRLLPVIARKRELHGRRKALFERIRHHIQTGRSLLEEAYAELGAEDPLTDRLAWAMNAFEGALRHMRTFIEKNEGIEDFKPDDYRKIQIIFKDQ